MEEVAAHRTTVLISSHRLEELQSICDRVLFLKDGTVESMIDVTTIQERYTKLQVAFAGDDCEDTLAQLPSVRVLARTGRVYTLVAEEAPPDLADRLREGGAVLIEPLPLRLEDLFIGKLGGQVNAQ